MEDIPVVFMTDTGASRTVVSRKVYDQICEASQPRLEKSACVIRGADGMPIKESGNAAFTLRLGPLEIVKQAMVADIEDDALLGYDVLGASEMGAADILLSKNKVVLGGAEIPCFKVDTAERVQKVTVGDSDRVTGHRESHAIASAEMINPEVVMAPLYTPEGAKGRQPQEMSLARLETFRDDFSSYGLQDLFSSELDPEQSVAVIQSEKTDPEVRLYTDSDVTEGGGVENKVSTNEHVCDKAHPLQLPKMNIGQCKSSVDEVTIQDVPTQPWSTPTAFPRMQCFHQLTIAPTNEKCQPERQASADQWVKYKDTFWRDRRDKTMMHQMPLETPDELLLTLTKSQRETPMTGDQCPDHPSLRAISSSLPGISFGGC